MNIQYSQHLELCQPKWRTAVDRLLSRASAVIWPCRCVLCQRLARGSRDLCELCAKDLVLNSDCCRQCAQPLGEDSARGQLCGGCVRGPPRFDSSFVPYRYAYPVDRMIQQLKYGNELSVGRVFAHCFAEQLAAARVALPEVLIPVPLGTRRFRGRGFNQAIELARHLRKLTGVEVRTDLVTRVRETAEQAALPRDERRKNVRGAFALLQPLPYTHVAILDDVVTTGSTVNEIAKLLRQAGAEKIQVWAIARAGK